MEVSKQCIRWKRLILLSMCRVMIAKRRRKVIHRTIPQENMSERKRHVDKRFYNIKNKLENIHFLKTHIHQIRPICSPYFSLGITMSSCTLNYSVFENWNFKAGIYKNSLIAKLDLMSQSCFTGSQLQMSHWIKSKGGLAQLMFPEHSRCLLYSCLVLFLSFTVLG